jgi:ATP-binding cassette, subfamily F, member 3
VSHDRYLIDRLATQIWDMRGGTMDVFSGTYQEYIAARNQKAQAAAAAVTNGSNGKGDTRKKPASEKVPGALSDYERKKRVAALEKHIEELEQKLATINDALSKVTDAQKVSDLGHEYNATEAALSIAVEEWGSLAE